MALRITLSCRKCRSRGRASKVSLQRELRLYHRIDVPQSRSAGSACSAKPCRGRIKCTDESARWDEQANSATAPMCTCPLKQQQEGATKALKLKCMIESSQTTPSVRSKERPRMRSSTKRASMPTDRDQGEPGSKTIRLRWSGVGWTNRIPNALGSSTADPSVTAPKILRNESRTQRHTSHFEVKSALARARWKQNGGKVCNWNGCVIPMLAPDRRKYRSWGVFGFTRRPGAFWTQRSHFGLSWSSSAAGGR